VKAQVLPLESSDNPDVMGEDRKLVIQVRASNRAAQAFYKRLGFVECGRLRAQVIIDGREDDENPDGVLPLTSLATVFAILTASYGGRLSDALAASSSLTMPSSL
jgi:ribosomal protein S18 acetylase RimI-like enzyme